MHGDFVERGGELVAKDKEIKPPTRMYLANHVVGPHTPTPSMRRRPPPCGAGVVPGGSENLRSQQGKETQVYANRCRVGKNESGISKCWQCV